MKKRLSLLLFLVSCIIIPGILLKSATAQVAPDGTTNTTVDAQGNDFTIQDGDRAGNNLFHSFQDFSVPTGGSAFFNNAADIANILSRVTGGNISNIDGLIRANGSANLFLINPAGIIFGQNASLNIGGSFYGSSASSILFEDGEFSAADLENPPLLTINAPIGLGFRDEPGEIINRSFVQNDSGELVGLEVDPGNNLALIGGNINFEAGEATAPGGRIELGGLANVGTVTIEPDGSLTFPESVSRANVSFTNAADVNVLATGGGSISVNANNIEILGGEFGGSILRAGITPDSTSTDAQAGDIDFNATGTISLSGESALSNSTFGQGNAGQIQIRTEGAVELAGNSAIFNNVEQGAVGDSQGILIDAQSLSVADGSQIQTLVRGTTDDNPSFGQGSAGDININVRDRVSLAGLSEDNGNPSAARSSLGTNAIGNAGNINITAGSFSLSNQADLVGSTFGQGNAGNISIKANSFSLNDGAEIDNSTFGQGNAGQIQITTEGAVELAGNSTIFNNVEQGAVGDSQGILIDAQSLSVADGSQIQTLVRGTTDDNTSFGQGSAGDININVRDRVSLAGFLEDTDISSSARSFLGTNAIGNAGNINITAGSFSLSNQADLDNSTFGQGNAGQIQITTEGAVELAGNSTIFNNVEQGAVGDSQGILIDAQSLSVADGSQIQTLVRGTTDDNPSFGQGSAGDININVRDRVSLAGFLEDTGNPSSARSSLGTNAIGNAGNINITAGSFSLSNQAFLASSTFGQGNAGNISIDVNGTAELSNSGFFSTLETGAEGNAGNISIKANSFSLNDGAFLRNSTLGQGNAGQIQITTEGAVELAGDSNIFNNVERGAVGDSQGILIDAQSLSVTDGSQIQTLVRGTGNAGSVNITATGDITFDGEDSFGFSSAAFSSINPGAEGDGGDMTISAGNLTLTNGGAVTVGTFSRSKKGLKPQFIVHKN